MWYSICNIHGTLKRSTQKLKIEERTMQHSTINDGCRVGIFEIAEHNRSPKIIAKEVNECFRKLNSNSHGQRVEKL